MKRALMQQLKGKVSHSFTVEAYEASDLQHRSFSDSRRDHLFSAGELFFEPAGFIQFIECCGQTRFGTRA
jgi:hypothetical protein